MADVSAVFDAATPVVPAAPAPPCAGSSVENSSRERRDFEGNADCEKGVVGESPEPLAAFEKAVLRSSGWRSALALNWDTFCDAEIVMYVSIHFAKRAKKMNQSDDRLQQRLRLPMNGPIIVSSNSPSWSISNNFPAPNAKTILSSYS